MEISLIKWAVVGQLGWLVILETRTTYWIKFFYLAMNKKIPHVNRYIKGKYI